MGEILDFAESLLNGETNTFEHHPLGMPYGMEKVNDNTWFHKHFCNTIIRETDDGLVIIDPAAYFTSRIIFDAVRAVTEDRLNTAIYTHGHVDHCFGVNEYADESKANGWPMPQVIAHEDSLPRFKRYRETAGYNAVINSRQFRGGQVKVNFPSEFYAPDITFKDRLDINVGGVEMMLRHCRGETDDHVWIFFPDTKVLCPGDLFFYCVPNAGNPQKVQRYCIDWAIGLREMMALEPEVLLPGHGWPIIGADRVRQALDESARLLESIYHQTMELLNQGATLNTIIHNVKAPEELLQRPYLRPVYDEPEFIVRNIWRLKGGWYDGTPSHLKPALDQDLADEIAELAGGAGLLADRAKELADSGNYRLACHLADWAHLAGKGDKEISEKMGQVYLDRTQTETSTMAVGIFTAAAGMFKGEIPAPWDPDARTAEVVMAQNVQGRNKE